MPSDGTVLLRLPEDLRHELKEPLGPIHTNVEELLAAAGDPIVAVGDVVTHHLRRADRPPDAAVVDGKTERTAVDDNIEAAVTRDITHEVSNPAATITVELIEALAEAIESDGPATILVEGEEDLAALPAVLLTPESGTVVYGQPGEGMVTVPVEPATRDRVEQLLTNFEGDHDAVWDLLS